MIEITFNGEQVFLLPYQANFDKAIEAGFSLPTVELITQDGSEKRRAFARTLRTSIVFPIWPTDDESPLFQVALQRLKNRRVLVPFWPAIHTTAWRSGIWLTYEPGFSAYEVHTTEAPANFVPSINALRLPLLYGSFSKDIAPKTVGGRGIEATIEFADNSPARYALAAAAPSGAVDGLPLPSGFTPKIFPFTFDWSTTPEAGGAQVEIKREQIGFGRELAETYYEQLAVRPLNISVTATSPESLAALVAFFSERQGSVEPFWLPGASAVCMLKADTTLGSAVIQVVDAATLGDNRYIFFAAVDGSALELRKVLAVDTVADTLTLDRAPLSIHRAQETRIVCGILARYRAPEIKIAFSSQRLGTAKLNFIETPHELVGASGINPRRAYLYRWIYRAGEIDVIARHTSYETEITIAGETYLLRPLQHTEYVHSTDPEEPVATIKAHEFDDNPLLLLVPDQLEGQLWLQILECFPDANGVATESRVICFGRVNSAQAKGATLTAEIGSVFQQLNRQVPAITKQKVCNYAIYSPACGVSKAAFTRTANIAAHAGHTVELTGLTGAPVPADWFAGGHAWLGEGLGRQSRTVTASTASAAGVLILTLNLPFGSAPIGTISIAPHCNRSRAHCKTRFNNWPKAAIFEWTPNSNPALVSRQSAEQGGKK